MKYVNDKDWKKVANSMVDVIRSEPDDMKRAGWAICWKHGVGVRLVNLNDRESSKGFIPIEGGLNACENIDLEDLKGHTTRERKSNLYIDLGLCFGHGVELLR